VRIDQYTRLQSLSEKLTDVVLFEADPAQWPGDGKKPNELTREERGDRFWSKKNAAATLTILSKVVMLTGMIERHRAGEPPEARDPERISQQEPDLDVEIAAAERVAQQMVERIQSSQRERKH
jgi:hypothetical protein